MRHPPRSRFPIHFHLRIPFPLQRARHRTLHGLGIRVATHRVVVHSLPAQERHFACGEMEPGLHDAADGSWGKIICKLRPVLCRAAGKDHPCRFAEPRLQEMCEQETAEHVCRVDDVDSVVCKVYDFLLHDRLLLFTTVLRHRNGDSLRRRNARIMHEDIDPLLVPGDPRFRELLHALETRRVELHDTDPTFRFGNTPEYRVGRSLSFRCVAAGEDDGAALTREVAGHLQTETAVGAGDDGRLAAEICGWDG